MTISQEFTHTFWQNPLTRDVYKVLFPPIMAALRKIRKIRDGVDSFPVFLTVTDISPTAGRYTDVVKAAEFVKYSLKKISYCHDRFLGVRESEWSSKTVYFKLFSTFLVHFCIMPILRTMMETR